MPGLQFRPARLVERSEADDNAARAFADEFERLLQHWALHPVDFVCQVLGAQPDPWQCDVLDALLAEDNVGLRACHGVGKTALLAWAISWFTTTRHFPKVPTTAPTFNKQVKDILWAEVHQWWRIAQQTSPWLANFFELTKTRLQHVRHPEEWFAVGIASSQPLNIEGYHSPHLLAIFDEAKGIPRQTWEAVHGMRTTQEAKLLCASTPGGPIGEFYKVFTQYRTTWRSLFVVHPEALRTILRRPEAPPWSTRGTYYSSRVRPEWVEERKLEWGDDSPVYIARVIGDFPSVEGDVLIPYTWLSEAEDREDGAPGVRVVSCDVARFGRDRTVMLVGEGGTMLHGEAIARTPMESSAPEVAHVGIGDDPRRPRYRALDITADACQRLRRDWDADVIVVDDTGLGGGVTDILRRRGERVIPLNFGASPTDKPRDADDRQSRQRRHLLDSKFVNLKSQMGWAVRSAFEERWIGLARLPKVILDPLVAQASMTKQEMDAHGRIRIVDPDEQDDLADSAQIEGRKSPDHFHALLLYWWVAGRADKNALPVAKRVHVPSTVAHLGEPTTQVGYIGRTVGRGAMAGSVGGQTRWLGRMYR